MAHICTGDGSSCDSWGMFYWPHDICGGNRRLARRQTVASAGHHVEKSAIVSQLAAPQLTTALNCLKGLLFNGQCFFLTQKKHENSPSIDSTYHMLCFSTVYAFVISTLRFHVRLKCLSFQRADTYFTSKLKKQQLVTSNLTAQSSFDTFHGQRDVMKHFHDARSESRTLFEVLA